MPFCEVHRREQKASAVRIFYRTYGHGDVKVLLIMGFAATHEAWSNQVLSLAGTVIPNDELVLETSTGEVYSSTGIEVCTFDNCGVGKSSIPKCKDEYTTTIMAMDAVALLDYLGWSRAHVIGHSLGAMISCKLAAIVPNRVSSLALLSTTGGGYQCIPKLDWMFLSIAFRFWRAKNPEERALVDLDTHYTKEYLDSIAGEIKKKDHLYKEYVNNISACGIQSKDGQNGQLNACWKHQVKPEEYKRICTSLILVSVIHGRGDIIAQLRHGRAIAQKLHPVARMIEVSGGHLITHENNMEVNQELLQLIQAAEMKMPPFEWSKGGGDNKLNKHPKQNVEAEDDSICCTLVKAACECITFRTISTTLKRVQKLFSRQHLS